jgi:hypothetical protein
MTMTTHKLFHNSQRIPNPICRLKSGGCSTDTHFSIHSVYSLLIGPCLTILVAKYFEYHP